MVVALLRGLTMVMSELFMKIRHDHAGCDLERISAMTL